MILISYNWIYLWSAIFSEMWILLNCNIFNFKELFNFGFIVIN